ncbi:MAG: CPBP family intramembrane metalloprotease [Acidobacteriaceae bacterium]|nr:CPBP family intramembrane metalloprotease [Acidobacteriaceae bacterium]
MHSPILSLANILAAFLMLLPFLAMIFFPDAFDRWVRRFSQAARILCPATLSLAYILVAVSAGNFQWSWLALYLLLPAAVSSLLWQARRADPEQRGNWRDFCVLALLGLAVDLRWFESAWPPHLAVFNKFLLLNTGLYGFLTIRQLNGADLNLRLRRQDFRIGLREFAFYAPVAIALGLWLGFLHIHTSLPPLWRIAAAPFFTFFFIAIPEEVFFRGWLQNLLERRLGRTSSLLVTALLFGLSHFNKRTAHFNWRYVLLAALAGIAYGRAWRAQRRVAASAITHTVVDTLWSLALR